MNKFAHVKRAYPMRGGSYPNTEEPSKTKQANGFKPTFIAPDGAVSLGDDVEVKELNFIFAELYTVADEIDSRLNKLEGK
ncbi:TPA: hypothetical protein R4193_002830 [Serratia marcescens]|uniref:hypothetical protein n=1 Tax=Serratia marcescens TaxID=615 RepID=UPI001C423923|nr:hypothetical protein [Serratia marcescens]EGT0502873.1 hypothetical protein [Serratia marcescens]MDP8630515.1 hypothetical protein [Serratia marcescens]MDP8749347.1 hypothetical protein [Serratia marcescens]MDP8763654.1 hypothetical protein [Serratia marcescens]HBH7056207.1 hypothetical protein [Serratia marcescens]